MRFDILTIFPPLFESFKSEALIARAQKKKIIDIYVHNLRRWTKDAHKTVDDRPYGGGAGMVMMVEPISKAVAVLRKIKNQKSKIKIAPSPPTPLPRGERVVGDRVRVIIFSAKGKKFTQSMARKWAKCDQLILICGRYEGIDERVARYIADEEISIGDYVLFGGEIPAMVVMEAVTRLLPGAVGKQRSIEDESFAEVKGMEKQQLRGILEYPHYTRPEIIKIDGKLRSVPKVLLTGNHKKIEEWRKEQSYQITKKKRPELIKS